MGVPGTRSDWIRAGFEMFFLTMVAIAVLAIVAIVLSAS